MKNQHPGTIAKALMKYCKLTQKAFAQKSQIAPSQVNEVLSGKRPITNYFCLALEDAGVGDAETWMFMWGRYDINKARASK